MRRPIVDPIRFATFVLCSLLATAAFFYDGSLRFSAAADAPEAEDVPIYADGALQSGWQDWSWAKHDLKSTGTTFHGKQCMRMSPANYTGIYLHHDAMSTTGLRALSVWVNGGTSGNQTINVCLIDGNRKFGKQVRVDQSLSSGHIAAGIWTYVTIPLQSLAAVNTTITGVCLQSASREAQGDVYFADLRLLGTAVSSTPVSCVVTIDTQQDRHPISPYIYGMASASADHIRDCGVTLNRWGGNPNTRYNWELGNAWNAARDWGFRNGNYGITDAERRKPAGALDSFIAASRAKGVTCLITIPTIGWVARDTNNFTRSLGVPSSGGLPLFPGSQAIARYDPSANQARTSVRSVARKGRPFSDPPDLTDDVVYQDELINHLVRKFGTAQNGGVHFYAMDNEPDIWDVTHTDVHPAAMSYSDLLANFIEYAEAVKDVDPTAMITGPVSWGWTGYLHSPQDRVRKDWNGRPDRRSHGDMEFIPWFLQSVHRHDQHTGKRSLDVLDIHFYPQASGVYSNSADAPTAALRIRSTRALWDPTYTDESWIAEPVMLIPRMRSWIQKYYPGTQLGLTEWNWGADKTMSGAIAIAECLGIFGREHLDLANYWTTPSLRSPGYNAFRMYRNVDGRGTGFGNISVRGASSSPNRVSVYASTDSRTGQVAVMLINKQPVSSASVTVRISGAAGIARCSAWRLRQAPKGMASAVEALQPFSAPGGVLKTTLPPYTITLLRFGR